ncbi:MAG: fructose bisphosphate aldolase [Acidimicrobiia bacterium]|nr:fructose bisphosphate aldolase [Acidimicrobiia bacterium]
MNQQQLDTIRTGDGFIAALDQSGGSTPKALRSYGIEESEYSGDDEMFDLMHAMRSRIMTSPGFTGDRVVGAILFEMTMDREVEGVPTPTYLWDTKGVVPFLKVDQGLADEADGVQLMKPITGLDALLDRAYEKGVFGTKMRSVVKHATPSGVAAAVAQQFALGERIAAAGLVPILEPEVDIHSPSKAEAEEMLLNEIMHGMDRVGWPLMFKLSLPSEDNFYTDLIGHPRVVRVVALSGGYSREEANDLLSRNHGMIASFSRALAEGLSAQQSDDEFDATLDASIQAIYDASIT